MTPADLGSLRERAVVPFQVSSTTVVPTCTKSALYDPTHQTFPPFSIYFTWVFWWYIK